MFYEREKEGRVEKLKNQAVGSTLQFKSSQLDFRFEFFHF